MTVAVFAAIAGILGAALLGGVDGAAAGACLGALFAWTRQLAERVRRLEHATERRAASRPEASPGQEPGTPAEPTGTEPAPPSVGVHQSDPRNSTAGHEGTELTPDRAPRPGAADSPAETTARRWPPATPRPERPPAPPTPLERGLALLKQWFTTGNVPVKVGVVLSLFGVGFLVKEAVDRSWMVVPLELRLVGVALFGLALLGLGWRLRRTHAVYALSVQGGGIAVLYLTIYASFALYGLLPPALAFAMLVMLTGAAGGLAVAQNARALAVLGIVGGFLAPVLTSSGAGSHVALFGYYAMLNLAILGIAWFKAWRLLNVLGFLFTFGIASLWGYQAYRPEHFGTVEPFLVFFVMLYTLIPILFATRTGVRLRGFVDGTLVFGTPLVAFALQARLVDDTEYGLAISAVVLAAWYVGVATVLHRRDAVELRVLIEALLGLGIAFVTVAVPLALDARWTSAAWALQGTAMVWLGHRQDRRGALAAGLGLQLAAGVAHWIAPGSIGTAVVFNGATLGAVLIAMSGGVSAWLFDRTRAPERIEIACAAGLLIWATAWWLGAGIAEIDSHLDGLLRIHAMLAFVCATALGAVLAAPQIEWVRSNALGLLTAPAMLLAAIAVFPRAPFDGFGWLAWPFALGVHWTFLRARGRQFEAFESPLHTAAYWISAYLVVLEAYRRIDAVTDGVWAASAALAACGALVLATLRFRARIAWPLDAKWQAYLLGGAGPVLGVALLGTLALNLTSSGAAPPLPYLPVLNPLELASAFGVLVAVAWFGAARELRPDLADTGTRQWALVAAALALVLLTMSVARTIHHWVGVPFDPNALAASTVLQAALSIVWGSAGLVAMLLGARRGRRAVWVVGAALMTIVVAKLFVVDLANAATVGRVVSFLGVGLLLLVVGYYAPVPPRAANESPEAAT